MRTHPENGVPDNINDLMKLYIVFRYLHYALEYSSMKTKVLLIHSSGYGVCTPHNYYDFLNELTIKK